MNDGDCCCDVLAAEMVGRNDRAGAIGQQWWGSYHTKEGHVSERISFLSFSLERRAFHVSLMSTSYLG